MELVYQEKISTKTKAEFLSKTTTIKCYSCNALFPVEYKKCPSCNMLQ